MRAANGDFFDFLAGLASWNPMPSTPPQTAGNKPVPYLSQGTVNQLRGSVFDAGAPAVPFVPSDDPRFSGGLPGRIAVVTGIDPQNSTQPTPPLDEQLRGFYRHDPEQPWFVRRQR